MKTPKVRLDNLLIMRGLAPDAKTAAALILSGKVIVNDQPIAQVGTLVTDDARIRIRSPREQFPYVSRGGLKLKAALDHFGISVRRMVAADVGASTGGFTDCLLKEGAIKVYAIDVGYGQLAWSLRHDPRVVVMERTNVRKPGAVAGITDHLDLVTIDVSFISLRLVIPVVKKWLRVGGKMLALIKPQFEAAREEVDAGGVVRSNTLQDDIINNISTFCRDQGFEIVGSCPSPLTGPAGNREFFILAIKKATENGY